MKTQMQMFYEEHAKVAGVAELFLELVKDGLTRSELARNIERRPELWGRFESWLDKLPN